jgi:hypothetical protein
LVKSRPSILWRFSHGYPSPAKLSTCSHPRKGSTDLGSCYVWRTWWFLTPGVPGHDNGEKVLPTHFVIASLWQDSTGRNSALTAIFNRSCKHAMIGLDCALDRNPRGSIWVSDCLISGSSLHRTESRHCTRSSTDLTSRLAKSNRNDTMPTN